MLTLPCSVKHDSWRADHRENQGQDTHYSGAVNQKFKKRTWSLIKIKDQLNKELQQQPTGMNERLVFLGIPLGHNNNVTAASGYPRTTAYSEEEIDDFYRQL